ncbi:hypothetical protein B0H12DRAFT_1144392 [Mycena haematopus]|nr:hypothetical protein B0H12DRAFT_1144392 [Mycena haematopus]
MIAFKNDALSSSNIFCLSIGTVFRSLSRKMVRILRTAGDPIQSSKACSGVFTAFGIRQDARNGNFEYFKSGLRNAVVDATSCLPRVFLERNQPMNTRLTGILKH